jgi:hypothetical protein
MNVLARAVYGLVTGKDMDCVGAHSDLSHLEQEVLAGLRFLLRRPPRDLAVLLAQGQWPEPWWSPPPSPPPGQG